MTAQASIRARGVRPGRRHYRLLAVDSRDSPHALATATFELQTHLLPALGSAIQIDAKFVRERLVYVRHLVYVDTSDRASLDCRHALQGLRMEHSCSHRFLRHIG